VFVPAADHLLHALDAATGRQAWSIGGLSDYAIAAYVGGVLYTGGTQEHLVAVDAPTGDVLWSIPTNVNGYPQLAVAGGTVFFGDFSGHVVAVRASDGQRVWRVRVGGPKSFFPQPSVANGVVYISFEAGHADGGKLIALDATDGATLWKAPIIADALAVSNGMVFAASFMDQGAAGSTAALYGYGL
jgi:outer membrane protein assembly factor BamB